MLEEKDLQAIAQLMDLKFQPLDSRLNNIEGHLEKIPMTDRFAIAQYQEIYIPKTWHG